MESIGKKMRGEKEKERKGGKMGNERKRKGGERGKESWPLAFSNQLADVSVAFLLISSSC